MGRTFRSSGDMLADGRFTHASDLQARGDLDAAADLLQQALELAPDFAPAWFSLGDLRELLGDRSGAIAAFAQALAADTEDEQGATLRLARLGASATPTDMPPAYVRSVFDEYADRFDKALVAKLDYRGHRLVADAVRSAAKARGIGRFAAALDLGCGTGLAGEALRGEVVTLTGVDLSPAMVAYARRKGIYEELVVAEALEYLTGSNPRRFELVLAADVFVYMGDLTAILAQAARVLRPGGLLAFTVETHAGSGVVLGDKLRFVHSPDYVRSVVTGSGLELLQLEDTSSRQEAGQPVPTLLAVASLR